MRSENLLGLQEVATVAGAASTRRTIKLRTSDHAL